MRERDKEEEALQREGEMQERLGAMEAHLSRQGEALQAQQAVALGAWD